MKTNNVYANRVAALLRKEAASNNLRDKAYWNLRNAGFNNIDAEQFLAKRRHWFS